MNRIAFALCVAAGSLLPQMANAAAAADEAAETVGEPAHPYSRWEPGYTGRPWEYEYRPERWSGPQAIPGRDNPYPPGGWTYPPSPQSRGGYPPSQWYTPPGTSPYYGGYYPPGNWNRPPQGSQWSSPPTYQFWGPGPSSPQWENNYPPQRWYGR